MEVTKIQLIEIALNGIGFLAAGALWALVVSIWQDRRHAISSSAGAVKAAADFSPSITPSAESERMMQFVPLLTDRHHPTQRPTTQATGRRNHAEVFAQAARLMAAGTSDDKIKLALPISDGELALMKTR
ncbi:MAG: hypothetical protein V3T31_02620 [candidate division Zixibacteria bacterium]